MKKKIKMTSLQKHDIRLAILFISIGAVLMLGTFLFGIEYSRGEAQSTMDRNISDLKKQINAYNEFLSSDEVKSLILLTEKAENISETLAMLEENKKQEYIESVYESQRLNCILVLDENLNPDISLESGGGYGTVEDCYEEWKNELQSDAVNSVLNHPKKLYSVRMRLDENNIYDIAVVARTDEKGVVFCAFRQEDENLELYYSPVRNLLARNETRLKGTLCIAEDGRIIATNLDGTYTNIEEIPEIFALEEQQVGNTLTRVVLDGTVFYGGIVKCRSYDIFAIYPASEIYLPCRIIMLVAFVLYMLIVFVIGLLHFQSSVYHAREINRQHEEYQAKLEAAIQNEQKANQSKTDFLRRMSHDIRTPINVIIGMLEIGRCNLTNTELLNSCRIKAQTAAEYLLELVNDILTLNKADEKSGGTQTAEVFSVQEEVQKVYLLASARVKDEDGVRLEPPQLYGEDKMLVGESLYLRQIMMNIITNAMRYSKNGGTVSFSVSQNPAQDRDGYAEVRFVCVDNGIGMSKEFQKNMFEPFAQESAISISKFDGVGLGLSIVQKLINRLNGTIEVESEPGRGTRFEIMIPYPYADVSDEIEPQINENVSIEGITVLIVEDNELNMEIAEFMLTESGANIIKAFDGAQAIEKFAASEVGEIDVILTDVIMPNMDGLEETRRIRALDRPDAKVVPIVAMTANLFEEDIREYHNAGMTGVLPKPLNIAQLVETVSKQITKGGKNNE